MERWEYMTRLISAEADQPAVKEHLRRRYPGFTPAKYAPEALEVFLNQQGEEGWELVHIEPVPVGKNGDVYFAGGGMYQYSHTYFCAFKRRIGSQPPRDQMI